MKKCVITLKSHTKKIYNKSFCWNSKKGRTFCFDYKTNTKYKSVRYLLTWALLAEGSASLQWMSSSSSSEFFYPSISSPPFQYTRWRGMTPPYFCTSAIIIITVIVNFFLRCKCEYIASFYADSGEHVNNKSLPFVAKRECVNRIYGPIWMHEQ